MRKTTKIKTYKRADGTRVRTHERTIWDRHFKIGFIEIYWSWGKNGYIDSWVLNLSL